MRGRSWTADDRTGGELDEVLDEVRRLVPNLIVERITVVHPGNDDDNVYFLGEDSDFDLVQVDTHPDGRSPFIVDGDGPVVTSDLAEAVRLIHQGLRSARS
jgi:hypothetical protein